MSTNIQWNSAMYSSKHSFVFGFGEALIDLLHPLPGESILDAGCGTGELTARIASAGADVLGIDSSPEMIDSARKNYTHLKFEIGDIAHYTAPGVYDGIFSNAVLHWVHPPEEAVQRMYENLKPGGRLVAEFGGKGNVRSLTDALEKAFIIHGLHANTTIRFWYFPSVAEYASLLEKQGFRVAYAAHFPRPTPLNDPENGIKDWFRMFGEPFFKGLLPAQIEEVLTTVQLLLREKNFVQGVWMADYHRIRILAVRE